VTDLVGGEERANLASFFVFVEKERTKDGEARLGRFLRGGKELGLFPQEKVA